MTALEGFFPAPPKNKLPLDRKYENIAQSKGAVWVGPGSVRSFIFHYPS